MARKLKSDRRGGLEPERYLSREQERKLRRYVDEQVDLALGIGKASMRAAVNQFIIKFMLDTGLRADETCHVLIKDTPVRHDKDAVYVRDAKGPVTRTVAISEETSKMIRRFVAECRKGAKPASALISSERGYRRMVVVQKKWVETAGGKKELIIEKHVEYSCRMSYRSLMSKINTIGRKAGLGIHLTPHMLRHTYAVKLYGCENDLLCVADQLGHADTRTTEIYAKTRSRARRRQIEGMNRGLEDGYL